MYVALPFPKCKSCGKSSCQGYHHKCGGALEINPDNNMVHCPRCGATWNIWNSGYNCSCGATFTSEDISDSVNDMLLLCKICMIEIRKQQEAQNIRKTLGQESLRFFVTSLCERLGYYVGTAVEVVINTLTKLLF